VTASDAHRGEVMDFSNLQFEHGYRGFKVYCRSKLANILFTRELAKRLSGTNVTANSLHPGFVATRFGDESGGWFAGAVKLAKLTAISEEEGARTIIYLASSPEVEGKSGGYYYKCAPHRPTSGALDDEAARKLWDVSAKISGVDI
jgi:NAD(P)-dependent dehydrogenase (short-subunit alcohol dehydrogenase family)